jgi:hypothetical protein
MTKNASGCLIWGRAVGAGVIGTFAIFVARIRSYDSEGTYKGIADIGMGPIYLLFLSLSIGFLAWFIWYQKFKVTLPVEWRP